MSWDDHHLVLIGPKGVGKTTVRQVLARRLGCRMVDADLRIEAPTGRTVEQILADDGVDPRRRLTTRALSPEHRPWLDDDSAGTLQRMCDDREPLNRQVADAIVVVDGLTPDEIADRIAP